MKIGTRSLLFGVHQMFIHPWFVAWAWYQLYGLRRVRFTWAHDPRTGESSGAFASLLDPRLWIAFFLHDIGYWGKPNMDGPEGERHPYVGAQIMGEIFGPEWFTFVLAHSRFLAKQLGIQPSPLCIADKLAITLPPRWLYLLQARLTGEIHEYMAKSGRNNETGSKYAGMHLGTETQQQWHRDMCAYVLRWVEEHKDGRADTWTPNSGDRPVVTATGVYQ